MGNNDRDQQFQALFNPAAGQRLTRTKDIGVAPSVGEFILRPSRYAVVLAAMKGGGGFFCVASLFIWSMNTLAGSGKDQDYKLIVVAGLFFALFYAGDHGLAWLAQRAEDYTVASRGQEVETMEKQAATAPAQAETGIEPARVKGPLNTAVISQTRPAAFHQMVKEILSPTTRLQFSDRACLRFGFDKQELIGELRRAGILHHSDLVNNAPALTTEGERALEAWLHGKPYPPPPNP